MSFTLAELGQRFQGKVKGDPGYLISGVGSLQTAGPADIAFLVGLKYRNELPQTAAGAVILEAEVAQDFTGNCLVVENPYVCFAKVAGLLHPLPVAAPGVDASAVVHQQASIADTAWIGAHAVIGKRAAVGERAQIGPGCWIGDESVIGDDTRLHANVSVYANCFIGRRCIIKSGTVIGGDGFGYANDNGRWIRVPQLGRAIIGDDVSIGANATIDRGALEDTVIGNGVKLDNQVHIAHNVHIGNHSAIAGFVGVAGSTKIGKRCTFGGQVGISDHLQIADDVHVTGASVVTHSIREPGVYSSGTPLEENRTWRKNAARIRQLDDMARRLKRLEQQLSALSKGSES